MAKELEFLSQTLSFSIDMFASTVLSNYENSIYLEFMIYILLTLFLLFFTYICM